MWSDGPKMAAKTVPRGVKRPQERPKTPQDPPKSAENLPRAAQGPPRLPKEGPRAPKSGIKSTDLQFLGRFGIRFVEKQVGGIGR